MPYKDPAKRKECAARWYEENKSIIKERRKTYPSTQRDYQRDYRLSNPIYRQKAVERSKNWALVNQEQFKETQRKSRERNGDRIRAYSKFYKGRPEVKIRERLRRRLRKALLRKNIPRSTTLRDLVGCSTQELKRYLETRFLPGMSWDNIQAWHIDHIKPCSSFDLSNIEEQHECFHWSNLQPLWAIDNLRKGKKWNLGK